MSRFRNHSSLRLAALSVCLASACSESTSDPEADAATAGRAGQSSVVAAGARSQGSAGSNAGHAGAGAAATDGGTPAGAAGTADSGSAGDGGRPAGAGGQTGFAGSAGRDVGGATGASGTSGSGSSQAASPMSCGTGPSNRHPFGCKFAWGLATPSGSLSSYGYVQFVSTWVGSEVKADGTISSCSACSWLTTSVAPTALTPVFYAYFIGFYGHANGLVDGNQTGSRKLTVEGAALIKANRAKIVAMHGWYAQQVQKVWPTKPLVWLLDGDYIQYADAGQSSPLTMTELGQLAADITCAIKSNMPNAVVAIDHSTWNSDQITTAYWNAMNRADYDLVWTTGVANNAGYLEAATTSKTYNQKTATYAYLHQLTGRTILVDTSAGISAAGDSWSTASAAELDARIAEGVVAANITGTAPSGLQANINALGTLNAVPACP